MLPSPYDTEAEAREERIDKMVSDPVMMAEAFEHCALDGHQRETFGLVCVGKYKLDDFCREIADEYLDILDDREEWWL